MSDLYTSQVHLKRLLAGQATPAFTPAPKAVLKMLDPAFMIDGEGGLGGLYEDTKGRLRCPYRSCGKYHVKLGTHIARAHAGAGGVRAFRVALSIPHGTALMSARGLSAYRLHHGGRSLAVLAKAREASVLVGRRRHIGSYSVMARNITDSCSAQLQEKITVLARELGYSPTEGQFRAEYGEKAYNAVTGAFGSWINAKAIIGLGRAPSPRATLELVLVSLREWVSTHGDLPYASEASNPGRAPRTPVAATILKAFGVNNWAAAMQSAIAHLDIKSERYGRPRRRTT